MNIILNVKLGDLPDTQAKGMSVFNAGWSRYLSCVILLAGISWSLTAPAEETRKLVKYAVNLPGKCLALKYGNTDLSSNCTGKMLNMTLNNGRSLFSFFYGPKKTVTFSGGKDEQTKDFYKLQIDKVYSSNGPKQFSDKISVTGECSITGDPTKDGLVICNATDKENGLHYFSKYQITGKSKVYNGSESESRQKKIIRHCSFVSRIGKYLGEARLKKMETNDAVDYAISKISQKSRIKSPEKLKSVTLVYWMFIKRLDEFKADTYAAYTLGACMTVYGLKKGLPVDSESEARINSMLAKCEKDSKSKDLLGACVLKGFKPIVLQKKGK